MLELTAETRILPQTQSKNLLGRRCQSADYTDIDLSHRDLGGLRVSELNKLLRPDRSKAPHIM
jgi:hypothetical protein